MYNHFLTTYGYGATLLLFPGVGLGICMDIQIVRWHVIVSKMFEIKGLPNFLRYVAPLARQSSNINVLMAKKTSNFQLRSVEGILKHTTTFKLNGQAYHYAMWPVVTYQH